MPAEALHLDDVTPLEEGRLVLAFSGWMNGGEVSIGAAELLIARLKAELVGSIDAEDFFIFNFPGSMEIASLFRPFAEIEDGLVVDHEFPTCDIYVAPDENLALLIGKEPHLRWRSFADCVLEMIQRLGVTSIYFIGSVAGMVPHSRDPRLYASVSDAALKPVVESAGLRLSSYEGPSSFSTYLMTRAEDDDLAMTSLVAEIPAYIEGTNPRCIEVVTRKLGAMLNISLDLTDLRESGEAWEKKLDQTVQEKEELVDHIRQLETDYDEDVFHQMGELQNWLKQQGVRLD